MYTQTTIRFIHLTWTHLHWKSALVKKLMSQISGKNNGMIVNVKEHQVLILGKT